MTWVYDIEADGLLQPAKGKTVISRIHCAVFLNVDTKELRVFSSVLHQDWYEDLEEFPEFLQEIAGQKTVAHNARGYDDIVVFDFYGATLNSWDTQVISQFVYPDLDNRDWTMHRAGKMPPGMPKKLYGRHSLEAWGHRLGEYKDGYIGDFQENTPELVEYCIQDVNVLLKLWEYLSPKRDKYSEALLREHRFQNNCVQQMLVGCAYDEKAEEALIERLTRDQASARQAVRERWPDSTFTWFTPKRKEQREGVKSFNPRSNDQVVEYLAPLGYKPEKKTKAGKPSAEEDELQAFEKYLRESGSPEADNVKAIIDCRVTGNRLSKLATGTSAYRNFVRGGRIYHRILHIGTTTHRCSHSSPPLGQATSVRKPYGKEFRELFITEPGYLLVGGDAKGLEQRFLGHNMCPYDGGAYLELVLGGDAHQHNADLLSDILGREVTRDTAKTFFYGLIYGASATKIGQVLLTKKGRDVKERFEKDLVGFGDLKRSLEQSVLDRGMAYMAPGRWPGAAPWLCLKPGAALIGLDGRRVPVRSAHSLLNFKLQSDGAIAMKEAVNQFHQLCSQEGFIHHRWDSTTQHMIYGDYGQVLMVHDEIQAEAREDVAELVGELMREAIASTTEIFGLKFPMEADVSIGRSWLDTH